MCIMCVYSNTVYISVYKLYDFTAQVYVYSGLTRKYAQKCIKVAFS